MKRRASLEDGSAANHHLQQGTTMDLRNVVEDDAAPHDLELGRSFQSRAHSDYPTSRPLLATPLAGEGPAVAVPFAGADLCSRNSYRFER